MQVTVLRRLTVNCLKLALFRIFWNWQWFISFFRGWCLKRTLRTWFDIQCKVIKWKHDATLVAFWCNAYMFSVRTLRRSLSFQLGSSSAESKEIKSKEDKDVNTGEERINVNVNTMKVDSINMNLTSSSGMLFDQKWREQNTCVLTPMTFGRWNTFLFRHPLTSFQWCVPMIELDNI